MPPMVAPNGDVQQVDDVLVVAARANFYTSTGGGGGGSGAGLEGDADSIAEGDPPTDPDEFMPEPQSCADIRFLLYEYERKRDHYEALDNFLQTFDVIGETKDILDMLLFSAGIIGISGLAERYAAIKAALEGAASQFVARLGLAGAVAGAGFFALYLANKGTKGRWDLRIASLNAKKREWGCED